MKKNIALIMSGGGARGAYQVGVLKAIEENLNEGESPFGVIAGVSVGAINAIALASGAQDYKNAIRKLTTLWRGLNSSKVMETSRAQIAGRMLHWLGYFVAGWAGISSPTSLLNNAPLKSLLEREIDFEQLRKNLQGPALNALAITTSSYDEGLAVTFYEGSYQAKEWVRSRRIGRKSEITAEHILASAALPFIFPARNINGEYYGDGALRQTAPLAPAIHLGADKLFVIGAKDKNIDEAPPIDNTNPYPSIGQLSGQMLDIVFNNNLEADIEQLRRVNETLATMTPENRAKTGMKHTDIFMVRPSEDIRKIAGKHATEIPWALRSLLRSIGAFRAPWVVPSYLTFEPGYINALIDLGYKDACNQMPDILEFLEL